MRSVNNNWLMPGHTGKPCCNENINLKMKPTADRCFSMKRFLDCETIGEYSRLMTSNSHVLASCKGSRQAMLAPFCHPDSLFILSCSFFCGFFSHSQFFVVSLQKKAAMDFVASQLHSGLQASKLDALHLGIIPKRAG